jgi:hypothetical protein
MINVMQIIVHMPLLSVQFPENAQFFLSLILEISSFEILPTSWINSIKSKLFTFSKEEPEEKFYKMGYESESSIENLGSLFIYLVGFFSLAILIVPIRFLKNRYQL